MNLKCRIFGHKTVRGDIENYTETFRCTRCNTQLIYPEKEIMQNTLRERAATRETTAHAISPSADEETVQENLDVAKRFRRAAELIDGNLPSDFGNLTFSITGEEGKNLEPTEELGVYIDGELLELQIVNMEWQPMDREAEEVLINVSAQSDKARDIKYKR